MSEKSPTAGATKQTMDDKLKGKGAKDMANEPKETDDTVTKGHDDVSKAGKVTKAAGQRNGGDQVRSGDQNVVNSVVKTLKGNEVMAIHPPSHAKDAVPTPSGWRHPKTNELESTEDDGYSDQ